MTTRIDPVCGMPVAEESAVTLDHGTEHWSFCSESCRRQLVRHPRAYRVTASGWCSALPSGAEDIYDIYAESFRGADHLRRILAEAQTIVSDALATSPEQPGIPSKMTVG